MKSPSKNTLVIALFALVVVGWTAMSSNKPSQTACCSPMFSTTAMAAEPATVSAAPSPTNTSPMPRLVELGADRCSPCKMMAPILASLTKEYAGKMQVEFIDVWKNPDAGQKYGVRIIPTQIFFDAAGKELFRHQGFFAKEDILAKWKELGVDLSAQAGAH